ncbi:MAG TPA: DUF2214 family protein [Steroidobacteraceae bacterium]|nr:DUF2214 family protein [Steroidobacteraceae bacterium]
MITNALFSFARFIAVFGIVDTLCFERLTMSRTPTFEEARRLQHCDGWYGIFAVAVLIAGFLRVFHFEKGSEFYFANPFFHAKLDLFAVIGVLSIYPSIRFVKWRAQKRLGMALCACFMARGIGS